MIGMGKPSMAESLGYGRDADRDGDGKYTCEKIQKKRKMSFERVQDQLVYDLQKGRFVMNYVNTINDFCALDITCAVLSCLVLSCVKSGCVVCRGLIFFRLNKFQRKYLSTIISDAGSDADSDVDDLDDATVMGSTVAYAEVEASIRALRYGSDDRHQGNRLTVD